MSQEQATATPSTAVAINKEDDRLPVALKAREAQFIAALPAHVPAERFMRVVLTAVQNNPALARADRASFFNACMKAAQDGLLPDGRLGALVIFSTKVNGEWVDKVAWMPMIAGIRQKVRNSDTIATWDVHAVYANDAFDYELGDDPFIKHKPKLGGDRGPLVAVYSVAVLKTGEKSRDVMSVAEVEHVRDTYSKRNKAGEFSPAWRQSFAEMAKKTVARRHSKVLPMSSDLDDLLRRDDDLYDVRGAADQRAPGPRKSIGERIDSLIDGPVDGLAENEVVDRDGEVHTIDAKDTGAGGRDAAAPEAERATSPAAATKGGDDQGRSSKSSPPDDRQRTPDQERARTAARVIEGGVEAAAIGASALDKYLEGLSGDEVALLQPKTLAAWRKAANAAGASAKAAPASDPRDSDSF
jgi:recombination protein RecT